MILTYLGIGYWCEPKAANCLDATGIGLASRMTAGEGFELSLFVTDGP